MERMAYVWMCILNMLAQNTQRMVLILCASTLSLSLYGLIDPKVLSTYGRRQVEPMLINARRLQRLDVVKQLEERLKQIEIEESRPTIPPEGATGPGEWRWLPRKEGQGEWAWLAPGYTIGKSGQFGSGGRGPTTGATGAEGEVSEGAEELPAVEIIEEGSIPGTVPPPPSTGGPPPPPGGPPAGGPPISGGGGISLGELTPKKKIMVRDRFKPALTDEELKNVSDKKWSEKEKIESDKLFRDVLVEIAKEVFVKPAGEKQRVTVEKASLTDTPFKAYLFYIKEMLIAKLGSNEKFKPRVQLYALIGEDDTPGDLFASIEKSLTYKSNEPLSAFLDRVRTEHFFTDAVRQFIALFASCVFDQNKFTELFDSDGKLFVANIVVTQRSVVSSPNLIQIIESQSTVLELFEQWIDQVRTAYQVDATFSNVSEVLALMYAFRDAINLLRLNPQFLKFQPLLGKEMIEAAKKLNNPVAQMQAIPLLDTLFSFEIPFFGAKPNIQSFFDSCKSQLFFTKETNLEYIITKDDTPILQILFSTYGKLLTTKRLAIIDPYELINSRLQQAKTIKDVSTAITALKGAVDQPSRIKRIFDELQRVDFEPNSDAIVEELQVIVGVKDLRFEKNLRKVLEKYRADKQNAKKALTILTEAKKLYQKTNKPVGQFIVAEFTKNIANKREFSDIERTALSFKKIFETVLGADTVKKVVTVEELYKWIEPYGLLMSILKKFPDEAKPLESEKQLQLLLDSLEALNTGTVPVREYVSPINPNSGIIKSGAYKGNLTEVIASILQYDFKAMKEQVAQLVAQAGVGAEKTTEFNTIVDNAVQFLIMIVFDQIVKQLIELNKATGSILIDGMPLFQGSLAEQKENLQAYRILEKAFIPLLEYLYPKDILADPGKLDAEKVQNIINKIKSSVLLEVEKMSLGKERLKKVLNEYFSKLADNLKSIIESKKPTTDEVVVIDTGTPSFSGVPLPPSSGPPPPGGFRSGPPPPPTGGPPPPGGIPVPPASGPPVKTSGKVLSSGSLTEGLSKFKKD